MSDALPPQSSSVAAGNQPSQWAKPTRYLAAAFLVVAIAVLLLFLIPVIDTVALGFIIAFLMYLPIRALYRRTSIRYSHAVILLYLLLVVFIIVIVIAGFSVFHRNSGELSAALDEAMSEVKEHENALMQLLANIGVNAGAWLAATLASIVTGALNLIGVAAAALFFSLLLMLAMGKGRGSLAGWVSPRSEREATLLLTKFDQIWVGYIVAQVIYGTALAVFSFFEYALLGVPYPFVMAVLTGFISLIPTIGGLLASLIVAIPCLLLGSTVLTEMSNVTFALLVLAINVVITQITYNFFALPIVGKYVKLPTAVVFIGVLVGVSLGSIVLAFLAVPILSTLTILGGYLMAKVARREPFPDEENPDLPQEGFFSQLLIPKPAGQK